MYYDINGIKMNIVSFGDGEETFLGVSGFIANWTVWGFIFEIMSKKWKCVSYSPRGSGESPAPIETFSLQAVIDDLFGVMDALEIEKCYLGGESLGGSIALLAAMQQPERFKGLIIVNTSGPNVRPLSEEMKQFMDLISTDQKAAISTCVESIFPEPDIEHIKNNALHSMLHADPETTIRVLKLLNEGETNVPVQNINIPTLIIYGDLDGPYTIENCKYLARTIPNAELEVIKGAGHVPLITYPKEVVEAIERRFSI